MAINPEGRSSVVAFMRPDINDERRSQPFTALDHLSIEADSSLDAQSDRERKRALYERLSMPFRW